MNKQLHKSYPSRRTSKCRLPRCASFLPWFSSVLALAPLVVTPDAVANECYLSGKHLTFPYRGCDSVSGKCYRFSENSSALTVVGNVILLRQVQTEKGDEGYVFEIGRERTLSPDEMPETFRDDARAGDITTTSASYQNNVLSLAIRTRTYQDLRNGTRMISGESSGRFVFEISDCHACKLREASSQAWIAEANGTRKTVVDIRMIEGRCVITTAP